MKVLIYPYILVYVLVLLLWNKSQMHAFVNWSKCWKHALERQLNRILCNTSSVYNLLLHVTCPQPKLHLMQKPHCNPFKASKLEMFLDIKTCSFDTNVSNLILTIHTYQNHPLSVWILLHPSHPFIYFIHLFF